MKWSPREIHKRPTWIVSFVQRVVAGMEQNKQENKESLPPKKGTAQVVWLVKCLNNFPTFVCQKKKPCLICELADPAADDRPWWYSIKVDGLENTTQLKQLKVERSQKPTQCSTPWCLLDVSTPVPRWGLLGASLMGWMDHHLQNGGISHITLYVSDISRFDDLMAPLKDECSSYYQPNHIQTTILCFSRTQVMGVRNSCFSLRDFPVDLVYWPHMTKSSGKFPSSHLFLRGDSCGVFAANSFSFILKTSSLDFFGLQWACIKFWVGKTSSLGSVLLQVAQGFHQSLEIIFGYKMHFAAGTHQCPRVDEAIGDARRVAREQFDSRAKNNQKTNCL